MEYTVKGAPMPVAICSMEDKESLLMEAGSMCWMSSNMKMETMSGGAGKMIERVLYGEYPFLNRYIAEGKGTLALTSCFPGDIRVEKITPEHSVVIQRSAFLAIEPGVEISVFFQSDMRLTLFGGESFTMNKLSGNGLAFLEMDGSVEEITLAEGEKIVVSTGYLVMADDTCTIEAKYVKGMKNVFLGGEGMFLTEVTGPGRIYVQTMPRKIMGQLLSYFTGNYSTK